MVEEPVAGAPDGLDAAVHALLAARRGHFLLESGHHGDLWLDLDAALWRPAALAPLAEALAVRVARWEPEVVCGPLVGGALLAYRVAEALALPFAPAQRHAHEPGALWSARYDVPAALRPRLRGLRVAVVDDVVNAGSAVRATVAALRAGGAQPVGLGALLRLGDAVLPFAAELGLPVEALSTRPGVLREPRDCPACARGEPLEDAATG